MSHSAKLNPAQVAQLAGLASARKAGSAGMAQRGAKGGKKTAETHGREHFIRAAHKRWGRLQDTGDGVIALGAAPDSQPAA